MNDVDTVGGYAVPVDPMDDLQCIFNTSMALF